MLMTHTQSGVQNIGNSLSERAKDIDLLKFHAQRDIFDLTAHRSTVLGIPF